MHFYPHICKLIVTFLNRICHASATRDTTHKTGSLRPRLKLCDLIERCPMVLHEQFHHRIHERL